MDIKFGLVASTIKYWKSDSEQRAMGEFILHLTGLTLEDVNRLTLQELADEFSRRSEKQGCQCQKQATQGDKKEQESNQEQAVQEVVQEVLTPEVLDKGANIDTYDEVPDFNPTQLTTPKRGRRPSTN